MDASYLRPEVLAFALEMERKLQVCDKEKGDTYKNISPRNLYNGLAKEVTELYYELYKYERSPTPSQAILVAEEAADVANYAMMIAYVISKNARLPT